MLPMYNFKPIGQGVPAPGQWYADVGELNGEMQIVARLQIEDDPFAVQDSRILLTMVEPADRVPRELAAPWLVMDKDGEWWSYWYEPNLEEDDQWRTDAPDEIAERDIGIRLSRLQYYTNIDCSKLLTADQLDFRESKMRNPWSKYIA